MPETGDTMTTQSALATEIEDLLEQLDPYIVQPNGETKVVPPAEAPKPRPSEEQRFEQIEQDLRQAMQSVPGLTRLADNLQIERAPEGLRIQIVDQAKTSMFPLGSAEMYEPTRALLAQVASAIAKLPNKVRSPAIPTASRSGGPRAMTTGRCPWTAPTRPGGPWSRRAWTKAGSRA